MEQIISTGTHKYFLAKIMTRPKIFLDVFKINSVMELAEFTSISDPGAVV